MNVTASSQLRHLPVNQKAHLAEMLDVNDAWKRLAAVILNPGRPSEKLYRSTHLNIFESTGRKSGRGPTSLLLMDWETHGPTVQILLDHLLQVNLVQAAHYIAVDVLKGDLPQRPEASGAVAVMQLFDGTVNSSPAAELTRPWITDTENNYTVMAVPDVESCGDGQSNNTQTVWDDVQVIDGVNHIGYSRLLQCTRQFSIRVGEGAFGEVYWGEMTISGGIKQGIAVKKLTFDVRDQFMNELRVMKEFVHPNLLPLLGYSNDNATACCLISPFMVNGSLEDRLAEKNGTPPLPWQTRLTIAVDTARGLVHLHTHGEEPLVHRDIKSANILLDEKFQAKVGDFGIARIGGDWQKTTRMITAKISGTCAYMPKEAFHGNVTVKMDTYSFGIVLLELLTGLAPDDPTRQDRNLLSHVKEAEDITLQMWKDPKAGDWPETVVERIMNLALKSTKGKLKMRLLMEEVLLELDEIIKL